jgi:predicted nucleotidyltransferase
MNPPPLSDRELVLVREVFRRHPHVTAVTLFGSRAKGTHTASSDVDLAVWGDVTPLAAEGLAAELDDLPLPYRFEVQPGQSIRHQPLRDHIERVGVCIYPAAS